MFNLLFFSIIKLCRVQSEFFTLECDVWTSPSFFWKCKTFVACCRVYIRELSLCGTGSFVLVHRCGWFLHSRLMPGEGLSPRPVMWTAAQGPFRSMFNPLRDAHEHVAMRSDVSTFFSPFNHWVVDATHWWWFRRDPLMIVKHFVCTEIHKAQYKCLSHSFKSSQSVNAHNSQTECSTCWWCVLWWQSL